MQRSILLVVSTSLLCASIDAQTKAPCTSPIGYEKASGAYRSAFVGVFTNKGRIQMIERSTAFNKAAFISNQVQHRSSTSWNYTLANGGVGRTFSKFSLTLGPAAATHSTVFSTNYATGATPVLVFTGKMAFPTLSGFPKQIWGNAGKLPFSKPYIKKADAGTVMDYYMENATLADNSTPPSNGVSNYWMDGIASASFGYDPGTRLPAVDNGCNDSSMVSTLGAYVNAYIYSFADKYPTATLAGMTRLTHYSYYTAPSAPCLHVATVGGNDAGVTLAGFSCNKLYINLGFVLAFEAGNTSASTSGFKPVHHDLIKANNAYAGAMIYIQGAWDDSSTKVPSLTRAVRMSVPVKPEAYTKAAVFEYFNQAGTKTGPASRASVTGPVPLFIKL